MNPVMVAVDSWMAGSELRGESACASLLALALATRVGHMPPTARLKGLLDRLDVVVRRVGIVLLAEPPIDDNGRHHAALRSGQSARASARIGDRWYALRHLFAHPREYDLSGSDVRDAALATTASRKAPATTPNSGHNAAA
jgi:hypothetical protein